MTRIIGVHPIDLVNGQEFPDLEMEM